MLTQQTKDRIQKDAAVRYPESKYEQYYSLQKGYITGATKEINHSELYIDKIKDLEELSDRLFKNCIELMTKYEPDKLQELQSHFQQVLPPPPQSII